jgi:hypothetical protein
MNGEEEEVRMSEESPSQKGSDSRSFFERMKGSFSRPTRRVHYDRGEHGDRDAHEAPDRSESSIAVTAIGKIASSWTMVTALPIILFVWLLLTSTRPNPVPATPVSLAR